MAKNDKKAAPAAAPTVSKPKVNSKIAAAIEVIKTHQPHVKTAYFNADGEYHFHPRKGFKAVAIIDEEEDIDLEAEPETDEPIEDEPVDTGKKLEF
jgi:hypothetical protein